MADWFKEHSGPSDSGSQESTPGKNQGGGSGSLNKDTGKIHYTDFDGAGGGRASWDEGKDGVENYHQTPAKK